MGRSRASKSQPERPPVLSVDAFKALAREGKASNDLMVATAAGAPGCGFIKKSINLDERTIDVVISTGVEDRSHDILDVNGWDFTEYIPNPVVLADHYHSVENIIANALRIGVVGGKLMATDKFATIDESPFADMCFRMAASGFVRGVSPGFRYAEWNYDDERGGINGKRMTLYEHSLVVLPDNQEALVAAKSIGIDLDPMRCWTEKMLDTWSDERPLLFKRDTAEMVFKTLSRTSVQVPADVEKAACVQTTVWVDDPSVGTVGIRPDDGDGMQPTAAVDAPGEEFPVETKTDDPSGEDVEDEDMKALTAAITAMTAAAGELVAEAKALREARTQPGKAATNTPAVRKSVHIAAVLKAALEKRITAETPRETLVAKMAEAANLKAEGVEAILSGEAPPPGLVALDALATSVDAPVDELTVAAGQDMAAPESAPADDKSASMTPLEVLVEGQKALLAKLDTLTPTLPGNTKSAPDADGDFDLDGLNEKDMGDFFAELEARSEAAMKRVTGEALTALTGRLAS